MSATERPEASDLRLDRVDVPAGRAGGDRILPNQVLGGHLGADVADLGAHVAVGQLEPGAGEGVLEVLRIGHELLADPVVDRVHLHRHVGVGHHRHAALRRVRRIDRHVIFADFHGLPLLGAGRALGELPLVSEEHLEIAHVELRRVGRPRALGAAGDRVGGLALEPGVEPAEALLLDVGRLRLAAQKLGVAIAVALADCVTAGGERRGLLVVHRHALEGLAHLRGGLHRVGIAVHALGVDVDQAHLHRRKRVLHRGRVVDILVARVGRREPFLFGAPVGVDLWVPDVLAPEAESEGLQPEGFVGDVAGQDDQVGPAQLIAVFLLDRPEQAAGLVEAGVVRPGVQRREADVAGAAAAAAVRQTVGTGRVPGQSDHQAAVMAVVGRPPVLAVCHQRLEVLLERLDVEFLDLIAVIEGAPQRVGLGVMLVQDVEIQRVGPPGHHRVSQLGGAAVQHRALAGVREIVSVHVSLRSCGRARALRDPRRGADLE